MKPQPTPSAPPPPAARIQETRYSLPELLAEIEQERHAGSFAMEKLNQAEIAKMFQNRGKRRAKKV